MVSSEMTPVRLSGESAQPEIPAALRGPLFERLLAGWHAARERRDAEDDRFALALRAFGVYARAQGASPVDMLRALNAVIDPRRGGDADLDWDGLRERAGQVVIASYYRDD